MLGFMPLSAAPMSSLGLAIVMAGSAGAYAATGQDVTWDRSVVSEAGAYALTGQDAELDPSLFFRCQTGDFTLTGQSARFRRSVVSAAGAYQATGQSANLLLGQVRARMPLRGSRSSSGSGPRYLAAWGRLH